MSEDTSDLEKSSEELYRALREEWEQQQDCCGKKVHSAKGVFAGLEDLVKWSDNEHLLEEDDY